MLIRKCDICKKVIKDSVLDLNFNSGKFSYHSWSFCPDCGKPIITFLNKNKLIQKTNQ